MGRGLVAYASKHGHSEKIANRIAGSAQDTGIDVDVLNVNEAAHVDAAGYDVFTRTLMRLMMRRGGHPTDASKDYDYTDRAAVDQLGRAFAGRVDR
jgi:menaquinone-dependent protoporphyrinogen IX oxidase